VSTIGCVKGLTILGASARAAAFAAARAGYAPHAIDCFADRDLAALCPAVRIEKYPRGFWRALAAAPDAPWMYTGGLENHPRLIERLAALRPLWGNTADVLCEVRNPRKLFQVLAAAGLAMPRLDGSEDQPALVKPLRGSAGLGIRWATPRDRMQPPRGTYLQEYVEGTSGSAAFAAAGGQAVLLGTTRQLVGRDWNIRPPFMYVGSIGPLPLRAEQTGKLQRIGTVLAEQFRLVGLFGVDFVMTDDEVWTIEVNPRYTASMEILEYVTGQHFLGWHAAACQSAKLPRVPPASPTGEFRGKAVVYARTDLTIGQQMPWDDASRSAKYADLPSAGQTIRAGHPIVTAFANGDSLENVEAQLRAQAESLLNT
jgi:predicted ATP-grasp superfamily ATP-dependent carboligase